MLRSDLASLVECGAVTRWAVSLVPSIEKAVWREPVQLHGARYTECGGFITMGELVARASYSFVKGIMSLGSWVFFKRVQVVGMENIPYDGPVILCANHTNGLADPILLTACCPRLVRYMMKDTLNSNPVLALFAWLMHTVPIMRRQDHADKSARNDHNTEAFEQLFRVLQEGGCVGMLSLAQGLPAPLFLSYRS